MKTLRRQLLCLSAMTVLMASLAQFAAISSPAYAVQPDEVMADTTKEARARALSLQLRCLVCQNQSIDDSDAPLARDLRVLVRERITAGDSDSDVMDYVVARYGDFVLLKPPFKLSTLVLWLSPILLLAAGIAMMRSSTRTRPLRDTDGSGLTAVEQKKLDEILKRET